MGNNYESAVIVAKNAIKDYPYSKYKEDLELLVLKARYQEASMSVDERKADRFRDVIDEYYSFVNNYPDSPNRTEAEKYLQDSTEIRPRIILPHSNSKYKEIYIHTYGLQEEQFPP